MLLGMAVGDSFGIRFENLKRESFKLSFAYDEEKKYSDDTQMTLAVAMLMVSKLEFSKKNLAGSFISIFKEDRRKGYSKLTYKMISSKNHDEFLSYLTDDELKERRSDGSAMRVLPIGFYSDINDVLNNAVINSIVSHRHPDAILACKAIALAVYLSYHRRIPLPQIPAQIVRILTPVMNEKQFSYLHTIVNSSFVTPKMLLKEYSDYGVPYTDALIFTGAVIYLIKNYGNSPETALREAIKLGGDTDTTAGVVLGLSLIHPQGKIEKKYFLSLENGKYGRDFIRDLGDTLTESYPAIG